jgi:hypothetical protein
MFETIRDNITAVKAKKVGLTVGIATREIGWEVLKHATLHHALADALRV